MEKLGEFFAEHPADISLDDIDMARIPRHVSCIMDGNGRWATARGLGRGEGHKAGIVALQDVITACVRLGVDVLSAYAFSTENWNRPQTEVNLLMHLFAKTFVDELPLLKRETSPSSSSATSPPCPKRRARCSRTAWSRRAAIRA